MRSRKAALVACILSVFWLISGCSGGGGSNNESSTPAPTGEVTLNVSGTVASIFDGDSLIASDSSVGKNKTIDTDGDGTLDAYLLTLRGIPLNRPLRIFLESGGIVYPLVFTSGNAFSLSGTTPFNLGFVALVKGVTAYSASSQHSPCSASGISCSDVIANIPTELTVPNTTGQTLAQLNLNGLNALADASILKARTYFKAAELQAGTETSNQADTARFFYAITTALSFGFDRLSDNTSNGLNTLGDVLDSFGMNADDNVRINPNLYPVPTSVSSNAATGAQLQGFAETEVLPEILNARAAAGRISSNFSLNWTEPTGKTVVESDYGDALLLRAAIDGILSTLYAQSAYNLDADLAAKANNNQTVSAFLGSNPSLGVIGSGAASKLTESRTYAESSLQNLRAAITAMETETDDQTNDFISLIGSDAAAIAQAKLDIEDAMASLNGARLVNDNADPQKAFTLDLSPFFAGSIVNLRALLPTFNGNNVTSRFPDVTMGGVFAAGPQINLGDTAPANNRPDILENAGLLTIPFTGWPYDTTSPYAISSAYLQYRNYENSANNRYQTYIGITTSGQPSQASDVLGFTIKGSIGNLVTPTSSSFYRSLVYYFYDCFTGSCASPASVIDSGFVGSFSNLPADHYYIKVEAADGQEFAADLNYPGQLVIPYVSSTTMNAVRSMAGDFTLSWTNPTTETNWAEVDQLRIGLLASGNDALYIRPAPGTQTITIPASVINQVETVTGPLTNWQIQTRAINYGLNEARGYSRTLDLP